jgi:hypothetical protein
MGPSRPRNSTRARKAHLRPSQSRRKPARPTRPRLHTAANVLRESERIRKTGEKPRTAPPDARRKRSSAALPDLDAILGAFCEAFALVQAAHMAQQHAGHAGPHEVALKKGIAELDRVYNDLDRATLDLARFENEQPQMTRGRR